MQLKRVSTQKGWFFRHYYSKPCFKLTPVYIVSRITKMRALERPRLELPPVPPKKANIDRVADENLMSDSAQPTEVAEYLASLLESARGMAGKSGMTFLAYLIQVAVEEAKIQAASKENPY
jgi:hypothetical protein